jgi:hypothetical protein
MARAMTRLASPEEALAWVILAMLTAMTLAGLSAAHISVVWMGIVGPALGATILTLIAHFYRSVRPEPRIAATCIALAQLVVFTAATGPLSYLVATADLPLQDGRLAAIDAAMGLDWKAYLALVNASPAFARAFGVTYGTLMPQLAVVLLMLGLGGQHRQLRTLVWAAGISGVVTVAISAAWPAIGCYTHYAVPRSAYNHFVPSGGLSYVPDLTGLRDGSLRHIDLRILEGIISFPSFHAALGALYLWGFWQNRWARWPGLLFEGSMIVGTPIMGGHYFADVIAGIAVAALSIVVASHIIERTGKRISVTAPTTAPVPA